MSWFILFVQLFCFFFHSFFQGKRLYDFNLCSEGEEIAGQPVVFRHAGTYKETSVFLRLNLVYVKLIIHTISCFGREAENNLTTGIGRCIRCLREGHWSKMLFQKLPFKNPVYFKKPKILFGLSVAFQVPVLGFVV